MKNETNLVLIKIMFSILVISSLSLLIINILKPLPTPKFFKGDFITTIVGNREGFVMFPMCRRGNSKCSYGVQLLSTYEYFEEFELKGIL